MLKISLPIFPMLLNNKKFKLAILTSHPIEYQGPLFKYIASNYADKIDLTVYFCWDFGVRETYEPAFGINIKWDFPILEGYRSKFLKNFSLTPTSSNFFGEINPGIIIEIFKNKYDAILIHGWYSLTNWLAFITAFVLKTPILLRGESSLYHDKYTRRPFWLKIFKKLVLRFLFGMVSAFLAIGTRNREFYLTYGASSSKIFSCPYAIDNDFFAKESEKYKQAKKEIRNELGIPADTRVILFVAKLIKVKGPIELLKAYEAMKNKSKTYLVFVGNGDLKLELEEYVLEHQISNIKFFNFVSPSELPKFYAISDIFVRADINLTSGDWGLTINEAMACGLIIITPNIGASVDLVKDRFNGFVYEYTNVDRLKKIFNNLSSLDDTTLSLMKQRSIAIISKWGYKEDAEGILSALRSIKQ